MSSKPSDGSMPLSGHLKELRSRTLICAAVLIVCFMIALSQSDRIVTFLTDLGKSYGYHYVYIAPQELLLVHFRVALIAALTLTVPTAAWEIYRFAQPGLTEEEQRTFRLIMIAGTICFAAGVLFACRISLPFMLFFLIRFSDGVAVQASISIQEYVAFLLTVFIIFGCVFEMPVVSTLLSAAGILKPEYLIKARKIMIVLIFLIAALITPPDIISQIMVSIPMCLLYELSILLSRLFRHRKTEQLKAGKEE